MAARDPFGFAGQLIESQFRVDVPIGEGGFSIVYRGHHLGLNEPIAVKCLKMPAGLTPALVDSLVERFRAESRLSYRLSQGNLNIVRSISSGTATSRVTGVLVPYIVLEWLDGHSLSVDFKRRRQAGMKGRTLEEMMDLLEPAATALDYAHRQSVVHRDIKPGNLFLADTRDGVRLKVLDFGLAKVLDGDGIGLLPTAQTVARAVLASPSYGAPEQYDPKLGPIGTWTDVYALTLVILEALADKKARPAESVAMGARMALDPNNLPTAHSLGIKVPPKVEVLLARAVALDKTIRPKDVGELWGGLKDMMKERAARRSSSPAPTADTSPTVAQPDSETVVRPSPLEPPAVVIPSHDTASPISPTAETILPLTKRKPSEDLGGTVMMPDRPRVGPAAGAQPVAPQPVAPQPVGSVGERQITAPMPAVVRPPVAGQQQGITSPAAASVILAPGTGLPSPGMVPRQPPPQHPPPIESSMAATRFAPVGALPGQVLSPARHAPMAAPAPRSSIGPPPSMRVRATKALLALLLSVALASVVAVAAWYVFVARRATHEAPAEP